MHAEGTKGSAHVGISVPSLDDLRALHYLPSHLRGEVESILQEKKVFGRVLSLDEAITHDTTTRVLVDNLCYLIQFTNWCWEPKSELHLAIVDSGENNAFAAQLRSGPFAVIVTQGLIESLLWIGKFLCMCPEVGRHCGFSPSKQWEPQPATLDENGQYRIILPDTDDGDMWAATTLVLLMLGCMFFHEAGHILNGHIGFVSRLHQNRYPDRKARVCREYVDIRRCLEYDADAMAASGWFRILGTGYPMPPLLSSISHNVATLTAWCSVSTAGALCYEDVSHMVDVTWISSDRHHPPSAVRVMTSLMTQHEVLKQMFSANDEKALSFLRIGYKAVITPFRTIFPRETPSEHDIIEAESKLSGYIDDVLCTWAVLRPSLEENQVAQKGLLAPS